MGIINCRKCGKEVSSEAKSCPHCGVNKPAPESKFRHYLKLGIGAVLVISMVKCISGQEENKSQAIADAQRIEASKTPEQRVQEKAEKTQKEANFQSVVSRLRALRDSTKNPKSFEIIDAILMDDGTLCTTYRGTNSFNAVIKEDKAIAKNMKIVDWNKFCGGKRGTDMKYQGDRI